MYSCGDTCNWALPPPSAPYPPSAIAVSTPWSAVARRSCTTASSERRLLTKECYQYCCSDCPVFPYWHWFLTGQKLWFPFFPPVQNTVALLVSLRVAAQYYSTPRAVAARGLQIASEVPSWDRTIMLQVLQGKDQRFASIPVGIETVSMQMTKENYLLRKRWVGELATGYLQDQAAFLRDLLQRKVKSSYWCLPSVLNRDCFLYQWLREDNVLKCRIHWTKTHSFKTRRKRSYNWLLQSAFFFHLWFTRNWILHIDSMEILSDSLLHTWWRMAHWGCSFLGHFIYF